MTRRYTEKEWINLAKEHHGNRYIYRNCGYTGMPEKVTVICRHHGSFTQRAQDHILGSGCQLCAAEERKKSIAVSGLKRRKSTEELVEHFIAVHGKKYDYTQVDANGTSVQ